MSRRRLDLDPLSLDGNTAERILSGSVPPADAPPRYAGVVRVLEAAARPPDPAELAGEVEAVALIVSALRPHGSGHEVTRRRERRRATAALLAALGCAGGLSLTSGLAAAGALPGFAQDAAAAVLDKVGVDVPSSHPDTPAGAGAVGAGDGPPDDAGDRAPTEAENAPAPSARGGDTRAHPDAEGAGGHGSAVADEARDAEPGPGHGGSVCRLASDERCPAGGTGGTDDRGAEHRSRGSDGNEDTVRGSSTAGRAPAWTAVPPDGRERTTAGSRPSQPDPRDGASEVDRAGDNRAGDDSDDERDSDDRGDEESPESRRGDARRPAPSGADGSPKHDGGGGSARRERSRG